MTKTIPDAAERTEGRIYPDQAAAVHPRSVLIASDDKRAGDSLAQALRKYGYNIVAVAPSGQAALDYVSEHKTDLVILSVGDADGVTVGTASDLWAAHRTPVIVLGAATPEHVQGCRDAGVFGVVPRDASDSTLRAAIEVGFGAGFAVRSREARSEQLERNLVHRRLVEQAKWKLVTEHGMTEPEAHTKLQMHARSTRAALADVARRVLEEDLRLE